MADEIIKSDANRVNVAAAVTNDEKQNIVQLRVDPITKALLTTSGGMIMPDYDYIALTYTGSNLTQVVYKQGGANGKIVATLTLTYDANNNLISVSKS